MYRRLRLILLAGVLGTCFATAHAQEPAAGGIRGVVHDKDFDVSLPGVRVSILGLRFSAVTSDQGSFLIEGVPAGSYSLVLIKEGYERLVIPNVRVEAGRLAEVRADLSSGVVEMEELVVTGADLLGDSEIGMLEIRAAAGSFQDAVSSEIISKAGASDAAGALKLVVGASVVDGKYATVRGLSDRYTGTTLNGVRVPSADPRRRAVQIDQFPTGTIDSVTVSKTFTPDLQGDFTGGGVDIRTKSIPEAFTLSASLSTEYNSEATGNEEFLTYKGGGVEPWGFDTGDRDLPSEAKRSLPAFPSFSTNPSQTQRDNALAYDRYARSFAPAMGVTHRAPGANQGLSIVTGNRLPFGDGGLFGVLGALTYTHKYDFYGGAVNNNVAVTDPGQPLGISTERRDSRGTDEVLLGVLGSFVLKPTDTQELSLKLILNQTAEDEARFQVQDPDQVSVQQNQTLRYTERTVASSQLHGSHRMGAGPAGGVSIDWTAAVNFTQQEEPDVRYFRNDLDRSTQTAEMPSDTTEADNTRRIFRDIEEDNLQGALDLTVPFLGIAGKEGRLKSGAFREWSERDYEQRTFTYRFTNRQLGYPSIEDARHNFALARFTAEYPEQLWTDVFTDPGRVGLATNTPPAPNQLVWTLGPVGDDVDYRGDQEIGALYTMVDLPLLARLRLIGGARYETTDLSIQPLPIGANELEAIEVLDSGDRQLAPVSESEAASRVDEGMLLPSLGLVFELAPNMNLRGSWSRTLARPTFREMAPVATEEFLFGDEYFGNPGLTLTEIANYDLRWEWFRRPGEVLAVSAFYKSLVDPIEQISFTVAQRSFIQPINYDRGRVRGIEVEARAPLDFLDPRLSGLTLGANYSYIDSEVEVPAAERLSLAPYDLDQPTRRLQGQPEYLLNLHLTWDHERTGTSVGLFYNRIGETLLTGAARGLNGGNPDVFEQPFSTLDVTFSTRFGGKFALGLKAKNLLRDQRRSIYRTPDGEEALKTERDTAIVYSLSGSVRW